MEWVLKCAIWQEDSWFVSHCEGLEIASQGRTIGEARDNLGEAIQLFLDVASFAEVKERLSRLGPVSPPEMQRDAEIRITSTFDEPPQTSFDVSLAYA